MHSTLRFLLALACALVLVVVGCVSTSPRADADDYRAALLAAITSIERPLTPRGPDESLRVVTLVVSRSTPPELRQACLSLRQTAWDYNLPDLDTFDLPSQHLKPESLVVNGNNAVFKGLLGPVPKAGTPAARGACGTGHEVHLVRQPDGTWRSIGGRVHFCSLSSPRQYPRAA